MKAKARPNIAIIAAAALLWLVLISVHFTSGMFARYTLNGEGGDAARVASFSATASADEAGPVRIVADGTDENGIATYTVKVKNDGETAVHYDAVVNFTGEQPTENKEKFDNRDNQLTFSGNLAPNSEEDKQLTFDMSAYFETNDKYDTFSNDDISGDKGKAPFEVLVTFTQID